MIISAVGKCQSHKFGESDSFLGGAGRGESQGKVEECTWGQMQPLLTLGKDKFLLKLAHILTCVFFVRLKSLQVFVNEYDGKVLVEVHIP